MSHDVFISYATEDKVTADAVCFGLEKEGIRCWMAPRDILPSDNYDDAIIQAIDTTRVMVVIFSSYIFQSQYVKGEVEYAFSKNRIIAPFRIENITPEGGLKLYLGRKHWLDAMTPPLESHIQKLAATIHAILAVPAPAGAASPQPAAAPAPAQPAAPPPSQPAPPRPPDVNQPSSFLRKAKLFIIALGMTGVGIGIVVILVLVIAFISAQNGSRGQASTQLPTLTTLNALLPTQTPGGLAPKPAFTPTGALAVKPSVQPTQPVEVKPTTASLAALPGSWQKLDSLPRYINDFEVDAANPTVAYAATGDYTGAGGGVYKSEDGGLSWKPVVKGLPNATVLALTTLQGASPVLLAALNYNGIYTSSDGGASWTSLGNPFTGGGQNLKAFALSGDRKTVFGLVNYLGVVRSDNAGKSWIPLNDGLPKKDNQVLVQSIAVDPANSQIVYAGTSAIGGKGDGVYKSTDGGGTWVASNKGMLDFYITALAVDPANGQVVFAGSGSGDLFKSSDGGNSWTSLSERVKLVAQNAPREIISIQVDPGAGVVYLAAANAGVLYSRDGGNNWRVLGIPPGTNQPQFTCMSVIFGEKPVFLLAVPGATTANGWRFGEAPSTPAGSAQPTAAATPAKALVLSGAWEGIAGLPRTIDALAVNQANPKQVFAGVKSQGSGSLYKSEDGGLTWQAAAGSTGKGTAALVFSSGASPTLFAAGSSGGEVYASQDGGGSWKMIGKSPVTGSFKTSLVTAPSDSKVILYVAHPGLALSGDGGQSWRPAGDGLPMDKLTAQVVSAAIDPTNAKIIYAGTGGFVGNGQGVYKSTDGGDTWFPANQGMLDYRITALAVDPNQAQVLYAGSQFGDLFKSADGGKTWSSLTEKLKIIPYGEPREIRGIQVDPGTGILYVAADNSGVLYSSDGGGKWRALGNPPSLSQPTWTGFSMIFGEKPVLFFTVNNGGVWRFAPNP